VKITAYIDCRNERIYGVSFGYSFFLSIKVLVRGRYSDHPSWMRSPRPHGRWYARFARRSKDALLIGALCRVLSLEETLAWRRFFVRARQKSSKKRSLHESMSISACTPQGGIEKNPLGYEAILTPP